MAVRFDASTDVYTGGGFTGTVATITCWGYLSVDRNAGSDFWMLWDGAAEASDTEAGLGTNVDGTELLVFDSAFTAIVGAQLSVGTWYALAVVMDGTSWSLYYGTSAQSLTQVSDTKVALSSPSSLSISPSIEWVNGRVANFKVYTAALTTAEIQQELAYYTPTRTANLNRWHPFVNAELVDYSGNANDLTAGGTSATTEAGPPIGWNQRLGRQLRVPASAVTNANAGSASISLSGQNPTVTRQGRPTPTAATVSMAAQNATVTTSVQANAGWANIILAEDNPTTKVSPQVGAASFTLVAANPNASTAITNAAAGTAALGVAAQQPTTTVATRPGAVTFTFAAQAATVLGGTNANPATASIALTAPTPSPSVKVSAGLASIGLAALGVQVGNLGLACANLTTVVTVDQHFGVVSVGDQHSASVAVEAHEATVGVEQHYAVVGVCGRS